MPIAVIFIVPFHENSFRSSRNGGARTVSLTMVTDETVGVVTRDRDQGFDVMTVLMRSRLKPLKTASILAVILTRTSPTPSTSLQALSLGVKTRRVSLRVVFAPDVFLTPRPA